MASARLQPLRLFILWCKSNVFTNFTSESSWQNPAWEFPVSRFKSKPRERRHRPTPGGTQPEQRHLPGSGVVLCPHSDELIEVVRPEDGGVAGQVLKVVHDDGHKQIQHLEDEITRTEQNIYLKQIKHNPKTNISTCRSEKKSQLCNCSVYNLLFFSGFRQMCV